MAIYFSDPHPLPRFQLDLLIESAVGVEMMMVDTKTSQGEFVPHHCFRKEDKMVPEAYVTLATNDGYAVGALVLAHSLKSAGTTRDLCVMIAPTVSQDIQNLLRGVYTNVVVVDVLNSNDSAHLSLLKRPELGVTFTKLHCWTLTQYTKCVFLDADMLAVQNPDDLFTYPELTAVCDIGWPDCFNSGMFVFTPSLDTYGQLLHHAEVTGSFDGGDQGLLNTYFPKWNRVSFIYNMVASATYTYLPAYKQFGGSAKLVHFLGSMKPWQHRYDSNSGSVQVSHGYQHLSPYLNSWWAIYTRLVQPGVPELNIEVAVHAKAPIENVQAMDKSSFNKVTNHHPPSEMNHNNEGESRGYTKVKDSSNIELVLKPPTEEVCDAGELTSVIDSKGDLGDHNGNADKNECTEIEEKVAQQLGGMSLGSETPIEGRERWERGEPDYLGRDSFANIQAYIDGKLKTNGK